MHAPHRLSSYGIYLFRNVRGSVDACTVIFELVDESHPLKAMAWRAGAQ